MLMTKKRNPFFPDHPHPPRKGLGRCHRRADRGAEKRRSERASVPPHPQRRRHQRAPAHLRAGRNGPGAGGRTETGAEARLRKRQATRAPPCPQTMFYTQQAFQNTECPKPCHPNGHRRGGGGQAKDLLPHNCLSLLQVFHCERKPRPGGEIFRNVARFACTATQDDTPRCVPAGSSCRRIALRSYVPARSWQPRRLNRTHTARDKIQSNLFVQIFQTSLITDRIILYH